MKPRIVFTGGGSAGHVTPNLALIDLVLGEGWSVDYIGSKASVEESMVAARTIPFHAISTGKLRRYFSWQNMIDPFKVIAGIIQSWRLLRQLKTDIVFSKGGFVAFPVVFSAWLHNIPVVAHESDISPGLANRLSFPFVNKICVTFAAAKPHFKHQDRVDITGTPIRAELLKGSRQKGLDLCGFTHDKCCLLIMGGGQGATKLNQLIRQLLTSLTIDYHIIHLCGPGKVDNSLQNNPDYYQLDYASDTLPDLLAAADMVISRSGSNALYEILALQKPHILVPLSAKVSRGDQIQNAEFYSKQGISTVLDDDTLTAQQLLAAIYELTAKREEIIKKIESLAIESGTSKIMTVIKEQLRLKMPTI